MRDPIMPICPKCSLPRLDYHCQSPTCDLVYCRTCDAYGTKDGQLWRIKAH